MIRRNDQMENVDKINEGQVERLRRCAESDPPFKSEESERGRAVASSVTSSSSTPVSYTHLTLPTKRIV